MAAVVHGTQPGYCDIIKATSKLAKHGRVRHTVTVAGPRQPPSRLPRVHHEAQGRGVDRTGPA